MSQSLKAELKELIVDTLDLDAISPEDISDEEPLFGGNLDLDSIDGLELVLQLEKKYKIKIGSSEKSKEALRSVNALADYISTNTQE